LKMVRPRVTARMKKPGDFTCIRVEPGNVWAFEPIAVRAREREIFFYCLSAMLLSEDMVDLKRQRESELGNQAVLATIAPASPDLPDEFPIHCEATLPDFFRSLRARDCITPRRLPICR